MEAVSQFRIHKSPPLAFSDLAVPGVSESSPSLWATEGLEPICSVFVFPVLAQYLTVRMLSEHIGYVQREREIPVIYFFLVVG